MAKVTVSCADWKEAVVAPLTLELPALCLPKQHFAEAKGVKSTDSKVETNIKFVNRSKQIVKIFWIDYEGNRQLRGSIKAGDSYEPKRTFLTHPWLIADQDDNAWYVYLPDAQARTVEVFDPGSLTPEPAAPQRR